MENIMIEGIATFSEKGFRFDSGLPSNEPVLNEAVKLRGTLAVSENACANFEEDARVYLPPEMNRVSEGECYRVKRTSRHYLIQLKVPVVENRATTEKKVFTAIPEILADITLDRREVLDV